MPPTGQPARLQDVINYKPDEYFSEAELRLAQTLTPAHFKLLRKAMIPTITDPELPIEQFADDAFHAGMEYAQIPNEEVKSIVVGRQYALKLIAGGLIKLKVISNMKDKDPDALAAAKKKDSLK